MQPGGVPGAFGAPGSGPPGPGLGRGLPLHLLPTGVPYMSPGVTAAALGYTPGVAMPQGVGGYHHPGALPLDPAASNALDLEWFNDDLMLFAASQGAGV